MSDKPMPEADYIAAFTAEMVRVGGETFADGSSIREYAQEVAPTYYRDPMTREDGPEAAVEADMDCWEGA
jgi:hypothetical protein